MKTQIFTRIVAILCGGILLGTPLRAQILVEAESYTSAVHGSSPMITENAGNISYFVSQTINGCESQRAEIVVTVHASNTVYLRAGWNMVGCPISGNTALAPALSSVWTKVVSVKDNDGFYHSINPSHLNSLTTLKWGQGYQLYVSEPCQLDWIVR